MNPTLVFFSGLVLGVLAAEKELPKGIRKCDKISPEFDSCVAKATTEAFRAFKDGSKSLGIPPIEPLVIPELIIEPDKNPNSPVSIGIKFKNMKIYGLSAFTMNKIKSGKGISADGEGITPVMRIEADYESNGKVLILHLNGKGPCNITMERVLTKTYTTFTAVKKNGQAYWLVDDYKFTIQPEKMTMNFANLINTKEKGINDHLNQFLNENWSAIFESLRPAFEEAFSTLMKEGAVRVFSKVPIKNIYDNVDENF